MKEWLKLQIQAAVERFLLWAQAHPRPVFWVLRNVKPILVIKRFALVSRFDDVHEILHTDAVFHVTYREKMEDLTGGYNFFLGMDDSDEYTRDVSHMRLTMRREDLPRLAASIDETAEALVAAAPGRIDAVAGLSRLVPARTIVDYFGIDGPELDDLVDWASDMFNFLFIDVQDDADVRSNALRAAQRMRDHLDACVAARKKDPGARDDVIGRCLALQASGTPGLDDLAIRNNLFGLSVGALPTTSKAAAFALDVLLDRPKELAAAGDAARAGDEETLAGYVFEALRFQPINPGLFRLVAEDYRLAAGHFRSKRLRAGTTVLAATQSAMFDGRHLPSPGGFRHDRTPAHYLHFGGGMHTCFGLHLNVVQVPRILKPLLKRYGLRRAEGDDGRMLMDGPFPSHLGVRFDVHA